MKSLHGLRFALLASLAHVASIHAGPTIRDVPGPVVTWKDSGSVGSIGKGSATTTLANGALSVTFRPSGRTDTLGIVFRRSVST